MDMDHDQRLIAVEIALSALKTKLCALERMIDLRLEAGQEALRIRTAELDKHLLVLNGKAEEIARIQATYLPREVADTRHEVLLHAIAVLDAYRNKAMGVWAVGTLLISALTTVLVQIFAR